MKIGIKFSFLALISCLALGSIISCENFMNAKDAIKNIEAAIDYSNSAFADVTISSTASETEYISPAAGNYLKTYRKTDEIKLSFIPNEKYVFVKWVATPEKSISFKDAASLSTKAIIEAAENPITITPEVTPRGVLRISFKADHGSIIPVEDKDFYLDDEFTIRYTEVTDYAFTGWKAYDASGNDVSSYLKIENTAAFETTCKVLKTDSKITVEATNVKRPKVLAMAPGYDNVGVNKDSNVKLIFTKSMASSSIYWTATELNTMGITSENYSAYKVNETDFYYAYKNGEKIYFKNITINERATGDNLLQHFGCPYFTNEENTIVLYPCLGEGVASGIDVEVTVLSSFADTNGIPLPGEYSGCYSTNSSTDKDAPIVNISNVSIDSIKLTPAKESEFKSINESLLTFSDSEDNYWFKTAPWYNTAVSKPELAKFRVSIDGTIKDASSFPQRAEIIIEPVIYLLNEADIRKFISIKQIETQPNYQDGQTYSFTSQEDGTPLEIEIPWNLDAPSGGYRIAIRVYDNKENMTEVYYPFIYYANEQSKTLQSSYFETPDHAMKGGNKIAYDNYEDFYIKCNEPNLAFAGGISDLKTQYYPYSSTITMYDELGKNWVPVTSSDLTTRYSYIKFFAKDIFGNSIQDGTSEYVSKKIANGDYPVITKGEYTKYQGDSYFYLYLTLQDNCSSQITSLSFISETNYPNKIEGLSATNKTSDVYMEDSTGSLKSMYRKEFLLPTGTKDGVFKIYFSNDNYTIPVLYIGITDGNGFISTYTLKNLKLNNFSSDSLQFE